MKLKGMPPLSRVFTYNLLVAAWIIVKAKIPFWSVRRGYVCSTASKLLLDADPYHFFLLEIDYLKNLSLGLAQEIFLPYRISGTSISTRLSWNEFSQTFPGVLSWCRILSNGFCNLCDRQNILIFCYHLLRF